MRDNVGTCMQATQIQAIGPGSATQSGYVQYGDVAGKTQTFQLKPEEARVLQQKHGKIG